MRTFIILATLCLAASQAQEEATDARAACATKAIQDAVNDVVSHMNRDIADVPPEGQKAANEMRDKVKEYKKHLDNVMTKLKECEGKLRCKFLALIGLAKEQGKITYQLAELVVKHTKILSKHAANHIIEDITKLTEKMRTTGKQVIQCFKQ